MKCNNFVLPNFPFVEDDFDALTDYELFSKMIGYVKELEDFINNKLDGAIDEYIQENFNDLMINAMYDSDNEKLILYKEVSNG